MLRCKVVCLYLAPEGLRLVGVVEDVFVCPPEKGVLLFWIGALCKVDLDSIFVLVWVCR